MAIGDSAVRHLPGAYRRALGSGLLGAVDNLFLIAFLIRAYLGPTVLRSHRSERHAEGQGAVPAAMDPKAVR
ncbi:MAG: hypothetical protein QM650_09785 [Microlunatus sp.]